ncbi:hypothetical protein BZA05DRAFT_402850 [Tricharina praecox]|uniref:uncharacterized protein n=1 Tax=Tricharina praecox TaxID=43433 RepID=UPI002220C015|nr:uncharacterized protein BZA05DRAFT_402850 [Tricharina praecox]KAI5848839.1 hypothetical protein BZA05DRAFT_402850 [Tricharina praecox]
MPPFTMPLAPPGFYNPPGTQMFIPLPSSSPPSSAPSSAVTSPPHPTSARTGKTLLVTTGATAPFPTLLHACLSPSFLRFLATQGISVLQLQAGSYLSAATFQSLLSAARSLPPPPPPTVPVTIHAFDFADDLAGEYVCHADVVVSHAGAGSVLDALRYDRPLVVVENRELMGGHQRELVEELGDYLVEGRLGQGELERAVEKALLSKEKGARAFPGSGSRTLVGVLEEELGVMKEG